MMAWLLVPLILAAGVIYWFRIRPALHIMVLMDRKKGIKR